MKKKPTHRPSKLGVDGWRAVVEGLRRGAWRQLTNLNLWGCELGPAGGAALAAALIGGGCPALTELRVGWNGLGDAGFGALAEALGRGACPGMATLAAMENDLTVLPEALCGVASLEELNLFNNDIGSLPHGLLHLTRLRRLWIESNPRLAAEVEIVTSKGTEIGALFAHLRSVHGGEPPPLNSPAPEPEPEPAPLERMPVGMGKANQHRHPAASQTNQAR